MPAPPPPPPGFVLDQPPPAAAAGPPPPPPGFVLDRPGDYMRSYSPFRQEGAEELFAPNPRTRAPIHYLAPDGNRYQVMPPEDRAAMERTAAQADGATPAPPPTNNFLDDLNRFLATASSGATFGLWDDLLDIVGMDEAADSYRRSVQEFAQNNPIMAPLVEGLGALATVPFLPAARPLSGVNATARIGNAAADAALWSSIYGFGAASGPPAERLDDAALFGLYGGVGGAGVGALAPPLLAGLGAASRGLGNWVTGNREASSFGPTLEREALLRTDDMLRREGSSLSQAADDVARLQSEGYPAVLVDAGGVPLHSLMRTATDRSPAARASMEAVIDPRFTTQSQRLQNDVGQILGTDGDIGTLTQQVDNLQQQINAPAYAAAYAAPAARAVWTPQLAQLTQSPLVQNAILTALKRARNEAAVTGAPVPQNPFTRQADGTLKLTDPNIVPNLQFWDIVQRDLRQRAVARKRGGYGEDAMVINNVRRSLLDELDMMVPEFNAARLGAAKLFNAENMIEAGQMVFHNQRKIPNAELARILSQATPAELALFQQGAAADLWQTIGGSSDRRSITGLSFINNPNDRERLALVFGREAADQIEARVAGEALLDEARKYLGNSQTSRWLTTGQTLGGGAAGYYLLGQQPLSAIIAAALAYGARRGFVAFEEGVATRIGQLLASGDAAAIREAANMIATTPGGLIALRNAPVVINRGLIAPMGPEVIGGIAGFDYNDQQNQEQSPGFGGQ